MIANNCKFHVDTESAANRKCSEWPIGHSYTYAVSFLYSSHPTFDLNNLFLTMISIPLTLLLEFMNVILTLLSFGQSAISHRSKQRLTWLSGLKNTWSGETGWRASPVSFGPVGCRVAIWIISEKCCRCASFYSFQCDTMLRWISRFGERKCKTAFEGNLLLKWCTIHHYLKWEGK